MKSLTVSRMDDLPKLVKIIIKTKLLQLQYNGMSQADDSREVLHDSLKCKLYLLM